ncbi:dihydroxyacetone kinase subunit DhaL [Paractinoplanes atraurantiacus]|uniref:Dihydroxyacetone kinase n=1 Tax=Paractinoplanes atraurantiacus TaxID=1036182 RepID=A0A285HF16_9ACTN|nr:dihydroxyacetone kinase subunit DhaL [Actinoplanes atraurantiacus]SNY34318.1 dihydroxyacetone kinase [Actinoplanes atraurantiacus]
MKKLINDPAGVVGESLDGLTRTAAPVARLGGSTTAIRSDVGELRDNGHVAVISGGGAGHEPAHAGYVGDGMLTAAVSGEVFTSPSVDAVLEAIRAVATPGGVLLIVKNYTGDRLNFGLAAELARAEGIETAIVVVADDVALAAGGAGRRGIAGTVLVHKVAGAAAAAGLPLAEVAQRARRVADTVGTMGVALSACTVPAAGQPGFLLDGDEVEWGLGIHGEPGVERGALLPVRDTVARLAQAIVDDRRVASGARVAVLVNGLGATPPMELSIMADAAARDLGGRGILVERLWAGNFLTALDMAGASLSILPVDDDLLALLDAPTSAPAWPVVVSRPGPSTIPAPPAAESPAGELGVTDPLRRALEAVAETLISARDELTDLDREVGDGDLGISLARGAAAILAECPGYPGADGPGAVLRAASATVRRSVGGTSGPLYAVLLLRAASALPGSPTPADWALAFRAGVSGVREVGDAAMGDRTMVDALQPAADAFAGSLEAGNDWPAALESAVEAAKVGATATAAVPARLGRSSYLGDRVLGHPDPGAIAVWTWLATLATTLRP